MGFDDKQILEPAGKQVFVQKECMIDFLFLLESAVCQLQRCQATHLILPKNFFTHGSHEG